MGRAASNRSACRSSTTRRGTRASRSHTARSRTSDSRRSLGCARDPGTRQVGMRARSAGTFGIPARRSRGPRPVSRSVAAASRTGYLERHRAVVRGRMEEVATGGSCSKRPTRRRPQRSPPSCIRGSHDFQGGFSRRWIWLSRSPRGTSTSRFSRNSLSLTWCASRSREPSSTPIGAPERSAYFICLPSLSSPP